MNVLLFDLDGTLVDTGGAGRRALERAFRERCGTAECLRFSFAGMTDRAIVRAGLRAAARPDQEPVIDELIERYLEHLADEVERSSDYAVYPGVAELLARAASLTSSHAVGLGTGNVLAGARIKLARSGLGETFGFGGFGCDHEDRAELLRIGAERGASRLGRPIASCRVVVIGDTPKDVAAARAISAECVAVATGPFSADELRAAGASTVVATLDDVVAHQVLIGGG